MFLTESRERLREARKTVQHGTTCLQDFQHFLDTTDPRNTHIYIYIHTHTHTHTYVYIYEHTHTHTNTHTIDFCDCAFLDSKLPRLEEVGLSYIRQ
jgi:hypothetical protein